MNRVTVASAAFLVFALGIAGWVLSRPSDAPKSDEAQGAVGSPNGAGLTFAEWSVRSDAVLFADIDPGAGGSTVPRKFVVFAVSRSPGQPVTLTESASFSWSAAARVASASALSERGFTVSTEGAPYIPAEPLFSDPVTRAPADASSDQRVTLRGKAAASVTFTRRRGDPASLPYWNRRAMGFASSDGQLVYITPDAIVVPAGR